MTLGHLRQPALKWRDDMPLLKVGASVWASVWDSVSTLGVWELRLGDSVNCLGLDSVSASVTGLPVWDFRSQCSWSGPQVRVRSGDSVSASVWGPRSVTSVSRLGPGDFRFMLGTVQCLGLGLWSVALGQSPDPGDSVDCLVSVAARRGGRALGFRTFDGNCGVSRRSNRSGRFDRLHAQHCGVVHAPRRVRRSTGYGEPTRTSEGQFASPIEVQPWPIVTGWASGGVGMACAVAGRITTVPTAAMAMKQDEPRSYKLRTHRARMGAGVLAHIHTDPGAPDEFGCRWRSRTSTTANPGRSSRSSTARPNPDGSPKVYC